MLIRTCLILFCLIVTCFWVPAMACFFKGQRNSRQEPQLGINQLRNEQSQQGNQFDCRRINMTDSTTEAKEGATLSPNSTPLSATEKEIGATLSPNSTPFSATGHGIGATLSPNSTSFSGTGHGIGATLSPNSTPFSATGHGIGATLSPNSTPFSATGHGIGATLSPNSTSFTGTGHGIGATLSPNSTPFSGTGHEIGATLSPNNTPFSATGHGIGATLSLNSTTSSVTENGMGTTASPIRDPLPKCCNVEFEISPLTEYYWETPNYPGLYPDDISCTLFFKLKTGELPLVVVVEVREKGYIFPSCGTCLGDRLYAINDEGRELRICGDVRKGRIFQAKLTDEKSYSLTFASTSEDGGRGKGVRFLVKGTDVEDCQSP